MRWFRLKYIAMAIAALFLLALGAEVGLEAVEGTFCHLFRRRCFGLS